MNIRPLRFFAAIVDAGGLSKAAERLNISQPAMSAALKGLEQELGATLFERSNGRRGLRLAPAGQRFYRRVVEILRNYDDARAELRELPAPRERLRLGVLETLPAAVVTAGVAELTAGNDARQVELWEGSSARLSGWLSQGRIDLAWTLIEEAEPNTCTIWREPFMMAVAPDSILASAYGASVSLDTLAAHPFILRSRCEMGHAQRVQLRSRGVITRVVVRAERDEVAFNLVARGIGITLAPRSLVPNSLVSLRVESLALVRTIGLRWRDDAACGTPEALADSIRDATSALLDKLPGAANALIAVADGPGGVRAARRQQR